MTVVACLGLRRAFGVREMGVERLRAEAARRNRRLLNVDVFAILIGRRDHEGRARSYRRDLAAIDMPAASQHEHVVARYLRVVGGVDARLAALIMLDRRLPISLGGQMAAGTTR